MSNNAEFITCSAKVLEALCQAKGKWGLYLSFADDDVDEIVKAAPYLEGQVTMLFNGSGWILFNTEEEMTQLYKQTVGDDGPTKENSYQGPARVYALTCNPEGVLMTENT